MAADRKLMEHIWAKHPKLLKFYCLKNIKKAVFIISKKLFFKKE